MFGLFKAKPRAPLQDAHPDPRTRHIEATLPLVAEELDITTRRVEGDTVRVDVSTLTDTETATAELISEAVDVRRVAMNAPLTELPETRVEGDVTIIPVVKERLVMKTELVLVEEIHITRRRETTQFERDVPLRRQVASVNRTAAQDATLPADKTEQLTL